MDDTVDDFDPYLSNSITVSYPHPSTALIDSPGEWSIEDLRQIYTPPISMKAYYELSYSPPWIDESLLDYSFRGLKSIKV